MLQLGSKGSEVVELQQKLITRGYDVGPYGADGDFGQGTLAAVKKFQADHGLDVDGIVGPATLSVINGSIGTTVLKIGSKGSAVKELQQKLISRGYSVGSTGADGDFGSATDSAVRKFQADRNLEVDGIVGPMTWDALNGFTNGELLKLGSKGSAVKNLQEKLIARGYSVGSAGADGDFGQGTLAAVKQFQSDHGLVVDGIVGEMTWGALNAATNTVTLKLGSTGASVKDLQEKLIRIGYSVGSAGADGDFGQGTLAAVKQFQANNGLVVDGIVGPATWSALNTYSSLDFLQLGSKGNRVKTLQTLLSNKGYSLGSSGIDGDFGPATESAVRKFQADHGLDVDGIVGPQTWKALNGSYNGSTSNGLLKLGSKGDEVRTLQSLLNSKGYSVGSVDGDFGPATEAAVRKFQADHGLGVDGIVGKNTWAALYGDSNINTLPTNSGRDIAYFIKVARSQLGYKEQPENLNKYGKWYGMNGVAWCAIFVSWCAQQAGIIDTIVPRYHWCENGVAFYKNRGRYRTRSSGYIPKAGDVIFFRNPLATNSFHTGIVEYVSIDSTGTKIHTIEGNDTNDAVGRHTYSSTYEKIGGYGCNGGAVTDNTLYTGGAYDRNAAVSYMTNKSYNNPDNGSANDWNKDKYLFFDSDCANFVSQALFAGGVKMNNDWYYKSTILCTKPVQHTAFFADVPAKWSCALDQYNYFSDINNGYTYSKPIKIESISDIKSVAASGNVRPGDLLYWQQNGHNQIHHASMITKVSSTDLYYSAHSSERVNYSLIDYINENPKTHPYKLYIVRIQH